MYRTIIACLIVCGVVAGNTFLTRLAFGEGIVVAVDNYPPWKIIDEENNVSGIDRLLLEAVLAEVAPNLKVNYTVWPWARCLMMLQRGDADMITGIVKRPEREEYLHFIDPPYKTVSSKAFYLRKGEEDRLTTYQDLYQLTIGVIREVKYFEPFDSDPTLQKQDTSSDIQNLAKLRLKRVDVIIGTESYLDYLIATETFDGVPYQGDVVKASYRYDKTIPVYFGISKYSDSASLVPRFHDVVTRFAEEGIFEKIIADFFADLNTQEDK